MPVLSRQVGPVQPEQIQGESTWGEAFGASAREAWETGPTGSLNTWARLRASEDGKVPEILWASGLGIGVGLNALSDVQATPSTKLTPADAAQRVKDVGLEKDIPLAKYPQGIRSSTLDILIEKNKAKQARQTIMSGYDGWTPAIAGMLAGSLIDPANVALSFIPVVREARYAKLLAQAGDSALARAGVRAGVGAAEGAVGAAIVEPAIYAGQQQWRNDYTAMDSMLNIAGGAIFGGLLHAGAGLARDKFGNPMQHPAVEAEVAAAREMQASQAITTAQRGPNWMRPMDSDRAAIESRLQAQKPDLDTARSAAVDRLRTQIEADLIGRSSGAAEPSSVVSMETELATISRQVDALTSPESSGERAVLEARRDEIANTIESNKAAADATAELSAFQKSGAIPERWRDRVEAEAERLSNPTAFRQKAASADPFFGIRPFIATLDEGTQAMSLRHAIAQAIDGRPVDVTPAMLADPRFASDPESFRMATQRAMSNANEVEGASVKASTEAEAKVAEARPADLETAKKRLAEDEEMLRDKGGDPAQIDLVDDDLKLVTDAVKAATLCMTRTGG